MAFPEDTPGIHQWMEGRQVAVGAQGNDKAPASGIKGPRGDPQLGALC